MSHSWQQFLARMAHRSRNRGLRRLRLETLEPRACPAVMFEFVQGDEGGTLNVIGDDSPNSIEIFQPRDRVVAVTGDGEQRTFEGVDEIFVAALGGDDVATSSKPKEIVVVGSKIHIDAGAGNDRISIDGSQPDETAILPRVGWEVSVDLGVGADELDLNAGNVELMDLNLRSADGGDRVAVGHTLGFRHEHTRPESRIDMDLGAGGNFVDVRLENVEDVDLSIVSEPVSGEPATGGTINVYWHVINRGSTVNVGRDDGFLQMMNLGGSASGVSPTSLSFAATAGSATSPSSANVALDLGSDDDTVSILTRNIADLQLDVDTGEGDDTIISNSAPTAAGASPKPVLMVIANQDYNLGPGNDRLVVDTSGYAHANVFIDAGEGDDTVAVSASSGGPGVLKSIDSGRVWTNVNLGPGNDSLMAVVDGYDNAATFVDAGAGDDQFNGRYSVADASHRYTSQLIFTGLLGLGNDTFMLQTFGYREFDTIIDTGQVGDGIDTVDVYHEIVPSLRRVSRISRTLDGGQDSLLFVAVGYEQHAVDPYGDSATHEVGHWIG